MARGGEHQALSLVVGASKTCSISRDAWGGTKRELGAIESQPHASLPGPDTCMPKRERHRCDLRGSSQWGATAPRWFANIPRVPLAIEGGKSGSRHTNESGISSCLLLPYHPLHPSSKCARSRRRGMGKGTCCCQYQRGGLKRSTCSPRLLFNGPCQVLGRRHLLARVETCRTSIFQFWKHLLPLACGCNPARTPQRIAASPVGVLLLFVNIPCLPKDGRSRHGPLSPSGVLP